MFDKKKYISYISTIEFIAIIKFFVILIASIIISIIIKNQVYKENNLIVLLGFAIGIVIGYIACISTNIKIEEMKMKLDIYDTITKK